MTEYSIDFSIVPWESSQKGFRSKTVIKESKKLRIVEFAHDFVEPDWCLKGHIGYIIEGEMDINFHGQIQSFKTGDALFIPKDQKHKHHSTIQRTKLFLIEEA